MVDPDNDPFSFRVNLQQTCTFTTYEPSTRVFTFKPLKSDVTKGKRYTILIIAQDQNPKSPMSKTYPLRVNIT
jgi:hypothetical protein